MGKTKRNAKRKRAAPSAHQAAAASRERLKTTKPGRTNARTINQEQQTSPAGKWKTGSRSSAECIVASITVSDGDASPRTIEVPISTESTEERRNKHRKMMMAPPWGKQNEAAHCHRKHGKKDQEQERIARQGKPVWNTN